MQSEQVTTGSERRVGPGDVPSAWRAYARQRQLSEQDGETRRASPAAAPRRPFALNREVLLRVITHNLMIIRCLLASSQRSRTVPNI